MVESCSLFRGAPLAGAILVCFTAVARGETITVSGDFGRAQYTNPRVTSGTVFNAWGASWIVATGKGPESGANPYPVRIVDAPYGVWNGGVVISAIPQDTEWKAQYAEGNSAAILAYTDSVNFTFNGVRIDGAWDSVRFAANVPGGIASGSFLLEHSWITRGRDDAVEDDRMENLIVRDCLIESWVGISTDPGGKYSGPSHTDSDTLVLDRVLMRLLNYDFAGNNRLEANAPGSFIKSKDVSPKIHIRDCVFAFDRPPSSVTRNRMAGAWEKTTLSVNNRLLWLADGALPGDFPTANMPSGFTIHTGAQARQLWDDARADWIARHPQVGRVKGDPGYDPAKAAAAKVNATGQGAE